MAESAGLVALVELAESVGLVALVELAAAFRASAGWADYPALAELLAACLAVVNRNVVLATIAISA